MICYLGIGGCQLAIQLVFEVVFGPRKKLNLGTCSTEHWESLGKFITFVAPDLRLYRQSPFAYLSP